MKQKKDDISAVLPGAKTATRPWRRFLICVAAVAAAVLIGRTEAGRDLERTAYDARASWNASRHVPSDDILVVAIDNDSMITSALKPRVIKGRLTTSSIMLAKSKV